MYKKSKLLRGFTMGLTAVFLLAMANVSTATTIYEQSFLNPIDGFQADANVPRTADDFAVAHVSLESIIWWGTYTFMETDTFAIKLYDNNGGTPANELVLNGSFAPNIKMFDTTPLAPLEFYQYQFELTSPLEMLAGNYFLSIQNQGTSEWWWLFGSPGNNSSAFFENGRWQFLGPDVAFRLEGTTIQQVIPEPGTIALMLLGCSGLVISRRLNRRHHQQ